jgi:integrase
MRWSRVDLDTGVLHVARAKGSIDSTHSLDRDELRDLRKLRQRVSGLYVFETERGGPCLWTRCNTSCGRPACWPSSTWKHTRICCGTRQATCWRTKAPIRA